MTEQIEIEEVEDNGCNHRWKIDSPNGPTSQGTCMTCGAVSEFKNSATLAFKTQWFFNFQII